MEGEGCVELFGLALGRKHEEQSHEGIGIFARKKEGQRKSKEQDGSKTVKSQYSEWRREVLEAQHWFSSIYWVIMLFV